MQLPCFGKDSGKKRLGKFLVRRTAASVQAVRRLIRAPRGVRQSVLQVKVVNPAELVRDKGRRYGKG